MNTWQNNLTAEKSDPGEAEVEAELLDCGGDLHLRGAAGCGDRAASHVCLVKTALYVCKSCNSEMILTMVIILYECNRHLQQCNSKYTDSAHESTSSPVEAEVCPGGFRSKSESGQPLT